MDVQKIEGIAREKMAGFRSDTREPGWILYHGQRTGKIAVAVAKEIDCSVDPDVLYTAGLFHDIGKGHKAHHEVGAEMTRNLLAGVVASAELEEICNAVRLHNQRRKSDSFSDCTKLIQDADLVDHAGLIDVWMAFYWSGHHGESIHDHIAYYKGEECTKSRAYIRTHLNYDVSRRMFEERLRLEDDLLSRFHRVYFNGG